MQERARAGLRIPYDLNTWLILESGKQGLSKNALILKILWDYKEQKELQQVAKSPPEQAAR